MLLYFSVGGYLSFKDKQEIYFTSPKGARLKNSKYENNFHIDNEKLFRPMKSSMFFGDNASGKTNFLWALNNLQKIIINGFTSDIDPDDCNINSDEISYEIEISDSEDNFYSYEIVYKYCFDKELSDKKVILLKEQLFSNDKLIYSYADSKLNIDIGIPKYESIQDLFSNEISSNTLLIKLKDFIPDYVSNFIKSIKDLHIVIDKVINYEAKQQSGLSLRERAKEIVEKYRDETKEILRCIDPTISDIQLSEKSDPLEKDSKYYEIEIIRNNQEFNIRYESQGVKKIINLLVYLLDVFNGRTVLVDELDLSIGTKAMIKIFNLFINSGLNKKGQLFITSHNILLLDLNLFHASQLNIFVKKSSLSTRIFSIDDFDIRTEKRDLYKLYLEGSFEVE